MFHRFAASISLFLTGFILGAEDETPLVGSPWLDQANDTITEGFRSVNTSGFWLNWQQFVPTVDSIERIDLQIKNSTTIPRRTGDIVFTLEQVDGTVLDSVTVSVAEIPRGSVWYSIPLQSEVIPEQTYQIRFNQSGVTPTPLGFGTIQGTEGNGSPYPNGHPYYLRENADVMFRVFGRSKASTAQNRKLKNLSVRHTLSGEDTMITGFVVAGSGPRKMLLRAIGPGLEEFDVTTAMPDPVVTIFDADGVFVSRNDNHANDAEQMAAQTAVGAFSIPFSNDAALLVTLAPGAYTAHVAAANGMGGDVLVELYDATDANDPNSTEDFATRMANTSTRVDLGVRQTVIAGFVIESDRPRWMLIRAISASLAEFGVHDTLLNGAGFTVYDADQNVVGESQRFRFTTPVELQAMQSAGAFIPENGNEAKLLISLPPGAYTIHVSPNDWTTGEVLTEIYDVTDLSHN